MSSVVSYDAIVVGGAAVTQEFLPGFHASTFSYIMGHVHPKVIVDLGLASFGLKHQKVGEVMHPLEGEDAIIFSTDMATTQVEIARFSHKDAEAYPWFFADFTDSLIAYEAYTPRDLEASLSMPSGHELHGEVALDQLFFQRPAPHYADYRRPIRGLYRCGSSTHPGGSVSAVPGHSATHEILKYSRWLI